MSFNYWQKFEEGKIYHIYNRSIEGSDLFVDEDDYYSFLTKYQKYFGNYFSTIAYCLIPNHFHILIKTKMFDEIELVLRKEETKASSKYLRGEILLNEFLEDQMRRFFSSFALKFNKKYHRRGTLFTPRCKRVNIPYESKLINMICYIHHNPIHHFLTSTYTEWKHSSYAEYLGTDSYFVKKRTGTRLDRWHPTFCQVT